jgi:hypothetical protein
VSAKRIDTIKTMILAVHWMEGREEREERESRRERCRAGERTRESGIRERMKMAISVRRMQKESRLIMLMD